MFPRKRMWGKNVQTIYFLKWVSKASPTGPSLASHDAANCFVYLFTREQKSGSASVCWAPCESQRAVEWFPPEPSIQVVSHKSACAVGACHLPPRRLNHVLLTCNTPERVQGGEQEWGALCSGKIGRTGLQMVRCSQELVLWAQSLYLLVSRRALNFSMVTLFLMTSKGFTRRVETFWKKNMFLIACIFHSPKITYIPSFFSCLLGAVSLSEVLSPGFCPK